MLTAPEPIFVINYLGECMDGATAGSYNMSFIPAPRLSIISTGLPRISKESKIR